MGGPSLVGWSPSLVGWRPSLVGCSPSLLGWRPSLLGPSAMTAAGLLCYPLGHKELYCDAAWPPTDSLHLLFCLTNLVNVHNILHRETESCKLCSICAACSVIHVPIYGTPISNRRQVLGTGCFFVEKTARSQRFT